MNAQNVGWKQVCPIKSSNITSRQLTCPISRFRCLEWGNMARRIITTCPIDSNSWDPLSILLPALFTFASSGKYWASLTNLHSPLRSWRLFLKKKKINTFLMKRDHCDTVDPALTRSLGRICRSLWCYQRHPRFPAPWLHALVRATNSGGAERGKAVRGPLTSQRRCLSKHEYKQSGWRPCSAGGVWETRRFESWPGTAHCFICQTSGAASRGNPCLKQWPSLMLFFLTVVRKQ